MFESDLIHWFWFSQHKSDFKLKGGTKQSVATLDLILMKIFLRTSVGLRIAFLTHENHASMSTISIGQCYKN